MRLGGDASILAEVRKVGGQVGPRTYWIGPWVEKSGWGGLESFYASCKATGDQPLVHLWYFGDNLSQTPGRTAEDVLLKGVTDKHQGVWIDWSTARAAALRVASLARAAGVTPIVTIESEFNQGGAESSAKMRDYLWDIRNTLKKELPDIKTVFAPGLWGDARQLAVFFRDVAQSMDYIGVQAVKFPPRHGDYSKLPLDISTRLQTMRSVIGEKPTCVHDCALSTYGGGDKTHPFAGGDGKAHEDMQADTLRGLASLESVGLEFMVYRSLKDAPKFALSNYGGVAERFAAVVRADGSKKPGYDALLDLATPPGDVVAPLAPEPPTGSLEDLAVDVAALLESMEALHRRLDALGARQDEG